MKRLSKLSRFLYVLNLCIGLLLQPAVAFAACYTPPAITVRELATGQTVYVQENHTQPIVTIDTWVNTGSAQETPQNNGVSHFLEHLLFKGTPTYKVGEIDKRLEALGASFNAATSDDFTHYHITINSRHYREALAMHADMLVNASIPQPELDRERKVVQEEINRALDNPSRKAAIALSQSLFGDHPYAMDTLGPKRNIQELSRQAILNYYHQWYQPENFKTIISGDVQTEEAVEAVSEAFQKALGNQTRPEAISQSKPLPSGNRTQPALTAMADPNLRSVQLNIGFLAPAVVSRRDNAALDLAAMILGDGESSRLYSKLQLDRHWVNDIGANNMTQQLAGSFVIQADIPTENVEKVPPVILSELQTMAINGPTASELEKARTQILKSYAFLQESTAGVAQTIGYNVTIASLEDYTRYVPLIESISAQEVQQAVRRYLAPQKAVMVLMQPQSKSLAFPPRDQQTLLKAWRRADWPATQQPITRSQKAPITASSETQVLTLDHGVTVVYTPTPNTQTAAIHVFLRGGQTAENKAGVSDLTARMLKKGTQDWQAQALAEWLEKNGLSLSTAATDDYLQIVGSSLSQDFPELLKVVESVLLRPTFPEAEMTKAKDQLREDIQAQRQTPTGVLFETLAEQLYPNHPYGNVGEKVLTALPTLSTQDVKAYYDTQRHSEKLVISLVGNLDWPATQDVLQRWAKTIPPEGCAIAPLAVAPLGETQIVRKQLPEQAATWIAQAWLAPAISRESDYLSLKLINTVLGSGLSSRLFVNLREKQGLAYQVGSQYPSSGQIGNFIMFLGTAPKNEDQVIAGFQKEIERLKTTPLTPEELASAKTKLTGLFALGHESNAQQAYFQGVYETLGVGAGFDKDYPRLIDSLTAETVQEAAQRIFSQPYRLVIVSPTTIRGER